MLHEIRWHGRAGQGIITASRVLAHAAVLDNKHAQAFPEFGPERLGAPISGFTRISDEPILIHSQIYHPNSVIVLDKTLLRILDVVRGITEDGVLLINAKNPSDISKPSNLGSARIFAVDADEISRRIAGRLSPNTPMIGALLAVRRIVSVSSVKKALYERFGPDAGEQNFRLVEEACRAVGSHLGVVKV